MVAFRFDNVVQFCFLIPRSRDQIEIVHKLIKTAFSQKTVLKQPVNVIQLFLALLNCFIITFFFYFGIFHLFYFEKRLRRFEGVIIVIRNSIDMC